MKKDKAFIEFHQDGHVEIKGGLMFQNSECAVWSESSRDYGHKLIGNVFIGKSPKWFEVKKWWGIIKLVKEYTK